MAWFALIRHREPLPVLQEWWGCFFHSYFFGLPLPFIRQEGAKTFRLDTTFWRRSLNPTTIR